MPPFCRVEELSTCWNASKMRSWSAAAMPGSGVASRLSSKWPSTAQAIIVDRARVGELDGIPDEVEENLSQPTFVAPPERKILGDTRPSDKALGLRERLRDRDDGLDHALHGIVVERQRELARLDLRQVENVVDERQQVLPVRLDVLQDLHELRRPFRRRRRRAASPCSRGRH